MSEMSKKRLSPYARSALDLGPMVLFFAVVAMAGIFAATAVFMVAISLSLGAGFLLERRLSPMALITAAVVLVFGGLTLYLHDKTFIKLKPTIIYVIFALILSSGALTGRNFLKTLFDHVFQMPEDCWRTLTWRWVGFFIFMAVLNEIVWRNFSDMFWAGFKLFGAMPLTFLFALAQSPFILKHQIEEKPDD
jgi:intracellular septation protein